MAVKGVKDVMNKAKVVTATSNISSRFRSSFSWISH
ncbi:hypothetical protein Si129_00729 [Streptococcus infantarius subsp. infantarius]|nr:hypothetical protein [Streptococcus infantarius subsp. infantarius]MCO4540274.1 hypothetical protein [Streptococcus infantarius subsp. infantarius]MCO4542766.1 hypothetical protein [Streptococcus infantarius subsp. infantarius]MCO4557644.1 hypothetical protein [Streptococcus infantarius subsp. infantarius]MCO4575398.1 hypothetical protein [Streptococcus infantarius subsp. infantarius]